MPHGIRDAVINRFYYKPHFKTSQLINRKGSARVFLLHRTELLQLVQNKNKVTLAVHQLNC